MREPHRLSKATRCLAVLLATALAACSTLQEPTIQIEDRSNDVVAVWSEVAAAAIMQPSLPTGTPEEQQPNYGVDMASVHLAIHDAVVAITGGYPPYLVKPTSAARGASQEAAASAAAFGVLRALFPSRTAALQAAYDQSLAGVTDGEARSAGIALGTEVGAAVVAARAGDGRIQTLPAFVPGTAPGAYRGPALVGRNFAFIKPFVLPSTSALRPKGPRALNSAEYAADLTETATLGSATSAVRSAAQAEAARFHTEPPGTFWTRNLRLFLKTPDSVLEHARLGAMLWIGFADAIGACFESKYHYLFWRPSSAINLADTDGNDATPADPSWKPFLPTPPHPEYPAAHGCASGAAAGTLRRYYGTRAVAFDFTSTVTGTTRHYASTDDFLDHVTIARIAGGMHFRSAVADGQALGIAVADRVASPRGAPSR